MKLSIAQSTMLRVIAENSLSREGERLAWYGRCEQWVEDRQVSYSLETAGPALRALLRKGLINPYPKLGEYSYMITDAGMKQAEVEKGKPLTFISPFDQQVLKETQGEFYD